MAETACSTYEKEWMCTDWIVSSELCLWVSAGIPVSELFPLISVWIPAPEISACIISNSRLQQKVEEDNFCWHKKKITEEDTWWDRMLWTSMDFLVRKIRVYLMPHKTRMELFYLLNLFIIIVASSSHSWSHVILFQNSM